MHGTQHAPHRASILFVAAFVAASAGAEALAQSSFPYVITNVSRTYTPLTGGTTLSFPTSRDDGGEVVQIPFDFTYFGQTFRHVNVAVNGHITFADSCAGGARCSQGACNSNNVCAERFMGTSPPFGSPYLPNTSGVDQFVAPFWDDLILGTNSVISVGTVGTAPRREFVIQWSDIERFSRSQSTADFQVRLEEGSNVIRIAYGTFGSASDNSRWSGLIGAESPGGTQGLFTQTCATTNSCRATDLINLNNRTLEISLPNGAELVGEATAPTGGDAGSPLPFALTVRNIGTNTTTVGFEARVYISTDATIDRGDRELGVLNFPALAAGASNTQTLNTTVPNLPLGTYAVGALVDTSSVVPEAIESNNVVVAQPRFLIGADLSASISAPASGGIGDRLSVTVNVLNDGSAQSAVGVDVYISDNATFDASDLKVGTATSAIGAVPSTPVTVTGTVPRTLRDGDYRLIAVVDPGQRIAESDETNNVAVSSNQITLRTANLEVASISVDRAIAFRGGQLTVTTAIENTGLANARGFDYDFYLSTNRLISRISDPELGSAGPLTVLSGETQTVSHTFTISTTVAIARYHVGVIVNSNGKVPETSFVRNVSRTQNQIVVRDPGPDFEVASIATPPAAAAGERLVIERAIFNLGNAAGVASYDVYLSEDALVDPMSDLRLLSSSATIAVGGEDFGLDRVTLAPTVPAGSYYIVYRLDAANLVDELDETNNDAATAAPIMVAPNQLAILTESLPFGTVDVPYGVGLGATGGAGAYVWSVVNGALPEGITLDAMRGLLSGSPTREGVSSFALRVTDGQVAVERPFTLLVAEANEPPEILTRALPPAFEGRPYEQQLTVYGGAPPYTWEVRGNLPTGMSFDSNGIILGTPTAVDLRMFSVVVTDALGNTDSQVLVARVVRESSAVRLSSMALPDGRIGDAYSATLSVADNTGMMPFTYTILDGALPPGLTLTDATIAGTAERAGLFDVTIRVVDALGDADVNRYLIEIAERNGVRFITASLPPGEIASAYLEEDGDPIQISAVSEEGSDTIGFTRVQGDLPNGVSLALDGTVTGTPARTGAFDFVVRAEDAAGQTNLRAYTLVVNDPPAPPVTPPEDPGGCACAAPARGGPVAAWLALVAGAFVVLRRRRGALALALLLGLGWAGSARAQSGSFDYVVSQRNQAYVERTSGGNALSFSSRDDGSASITLPFPFRFYGQDYTTVQVSTNGWVLFGSGSATSLSNRALPTRFAPNNLIALWWDDLETSGEDWFVEGTAPNRRVIIQYRNANRLFQASSGRVRVQLHLFEGRSRFEVHYGGVANAGGSASWSFSAGYEDATGTRGRDLLGCGASCNRGDVPSDRVYLVQEDGGIDVVARSITAPVAASPGSPVDLSFEIGSVHANPIGPFSYELYLVPAASSMPSGMALASGSVILQPFQIQSLSARVTIPAGTPLGRYRFALVVDSGNVVREPNETDNLAFSDFVRVQTPRPDFAIGSVTPSSMMVAPGGSLDVSFELLNQGGVSGDADVSVVLSRNAVITADDRAIDTQRETLPMLSTSSVTRTITLPTDVLPGPYTVGVVADPMDTVTEGSEVNNTGAATGQLLVTAGQSLSIAEQTIPAPYLNVPYTVYLTPVGGDGTYDWSVTSGTLPRGLVLIPTTGEIRGTPIETGRSSVTVQVRSGMATATQSYDLDVTQPVGALTITTRQLLPGTVERDYPPVEAGAMPQRIRALGGTGTVAFSLDSPAPPGITFSEDGVFSGVPTQAGRFSVDVRATDGAGAEATRTLFLTVGEPGRITLVADALPAARLDTPYAAQLRVIGITSSVAPQFESPGPLPPGIVVASTGVIAGTPRQVGVFTFPVNVTEGEMGQTDSALFRVEVTADDSLSIRIEGAVTATVGRTLDVSLVAVGGSPPFSWRGGDDLPDGLTAEVEGGEGTVYRIRGRLDEEEVVTFLPTVTDANQRTVRRAVSFRFLPEPPPPVVEEPGGCRAAGQPAKTESVGLAALLLGLALVLRRRS